jgi:flagellar hook-associated protein 2
MGGTDFKIKVNGVEKTITTADTSLKGVVDAINKTADLGVKATAFQKAPGQYTMQLTSSTTGADSAFEFVDPSQFSALGGTQVATEGSDAVLSVGTKTPFEVRSSSNTFKGLLDGLTVNATKVQKSDDAPVTVTIASDTEAIATKVQAMVDAANSALSEIATQTKNKSGAVAGGPLSGNGSMSQLATQVLGTVSGGAGPGGSFKAVGIELNRNGQLSFDKTAFLAALNADPVKTKSYFIDSTNATNGLADKVKAVADKATQTSTGTLSRLITSRTDAITELNDRIGDWDVRLAARRTTLQKQFTAMETALGSLKNQSSWLSGQISSLG